MRERVEVEGFRRRENGEEKGKRNGRGRENGKGERVGAGMGAGEEWE